MPALANPFVHSLAPFLMVVIAMTAGALIPFARGVVVADTDMGILLVLALTSISVYGVTLAGWSSNSKYSLLGGLRSSAQMISYELSIGLSILGIVLIYETAESSISDTWRLCGAWFQLWTSATSIANW